MDGDTVILTDKGEIPIKHLVDCNIKVPTVDENGNIVTSETCTVKPTAIVNDYMEITLEDDTIIKCTLNHRFMLSDGTYKEAKDLEQEAAENCQKAKCAYEKAENYNEQLVKELEEKVFSVYGLTEVEPEIIQNEEQAMAFVADIEEALSDSIFHIADYMIETEIEELYKTADYAENINIGTCEGLVEADMVANGYTKIELNDSTGLYYRVTEEKLTLVNFVNNYRAEISLAGGSPVASLMAKAVASDDFIT